MAQPPAALVPRTPSMAPLRAPSMLFTLFGDYAYPSGRDIRLAALVTIGKALGVSEVAVRSAVARLAREGWIAARRTSNRSHYGLSDAGRRLIDEGTQRIYRPWRGAWSGEWCVLNYSIPETRRSERDRIRKQLAWLGFGAMGGGAYVSPRDVSAQAERLLQAHRLHRFARVFRGRLTGPGTDADLASQCWDLRAIARRYEAFVRHYEPIHRRDTRLCRLGSLCDGDAFVTRFALTHDFRRFPFIDPDLPHHVLPRNWAGARARSLFEKHHTLLTTLALRFFERVAGDRG